MNRRSLVSYVAVAMTTVFLQANSVAAPETWRIGTVIAPPAVLGVIVDEMAASITKATGGEIKGERIQQRNEQEIAQNVMRGRYEMSYMSVAGIAPAIPELAVLSMPYLWESTQERDYVTDKFAVPLVAKILADHGLTLVRYGEGGWINMFCRTACTEPETLKGMKVRISATAGDRMMFSRLGANYVNMTLGDFFAGLQQGIVDAGALTFGFYVSGPPARPAPHYVFTEHSQLAMFLIAHRAYWDRLPEERRKAIENALISTAEIRKRVADEDIPATKRQLSQGGFVHALTPAQRAKWAALVTPGHAELVESFGPRGRQLYDEIVKGKEEFRKTKK